MDDDAREELRVLRARAYGPSADIARDPLAVRRLDELEALSRPMLPATIQIRVGPDMPEALRERYPDGTALQFVQDGSRIGVFSDAE